MELLRNGKKSTTRDQTHSVTAIQYITKQLIDRCFFAGAGNNLNYNGYFDNHSRSFHDHDIPTCALIHDFMMLYSKLV